MSELAPSTEGPTLLKVSVSTLGSTMMSALGTITPVMEPVSARASAKASATESTLTPVTAVARATAPELVPARSRRARWRCVGEGVGASEGVGEGVGAGIDAEAGVDVVEPVSALRSALAPELVYPTRLSTPRSAKASVPVPTLMPSRPMSAVASFTALMAVMFPSELHPGQAAATALASTTLAVPVLPGISRGTSRRPAASHSSGS